MMGMVHAVIIVDFSYSGLMPDWPFMKPNEMSRDRKVESWRAEPGSVSGEHDSEQSLIAWHIVCLSVRFRRVLPSRIRICSKPSGPQDVNRFHQWASLLWIDCWIRLFQCYQQQYKLLSRWWVILFSSPWASDLTWMHIVRPNSIVLVLLGYQSFSTCCYHKSCWIANWNMKTDAWIALASHESNHSWSELSWSFDMVNWLHFILLLFRTEHDRREGSRVSQSPLTDWMNEILSLLYCYSSCLIVIRGTLDLPSGFLCPLILFLLFSPSFIPSDDHHPCYSLLIYASSNVLWTVVFFHESWRRLFFV